MESRINELTHKKLVNAMEFVEGWTVEQTLGEGAYGEVKLLLNRSSGDAVAMKVVNIERHEEAKTLIRKEVCIHRMLSDPHIIRFFGHRREENLEYIFLEYAAGGELFDQIEPDLGMAPWQAQKYFKHLIAGVEYLHSRGVAHRDLKPENLLLDEHDNLKISDFGMATMYRLKGQERPLQKQCGTMPYVAPEVLIRPYKAEPADIWSCGIILIAMLCGELPWDQPTSDCVEYMAWKNHKYTHLSPWTKVDNMVLSLAKRILVPIPSSRMTIAQIKAHRWSNKKLTKEIGSARSWDSPPSGGMPTKRVGSMLSNSLNDNDFTRLCHSQPEPNHPEEQLSVPCNQDEKIGFCFSQPAAMDDLFLSSQINYTQHTQSSQTPIQKLVRRMTRFFVRVSCEEAVTILSDLLIKDGFTLKRNSAHMLTISTTDKRKKPLVFKSSVLDMNGKTLLDFRLSKGCGIEFKRSFVKIKERLGDIVLKGLVMWPVAFATNSIP